MRHTVLFVDDEVNILRAVARLLRREPYQILAASSSAEAIELSIQERPDVVVSDLDMPDCDGLDLLRTIHHHLPDVVPILMTAWPSAEAIAAEESGEIFRVVVKPWDCDGLKATLSAACGRFDAQHARGPGTLGEDGLARHS